ncbi:MAG TPA: hypothetical protein VNW54_16280 [Granulicella sp.]|nr:hypothetical protein [Granulicella sp.]
MTMRYAHLALDRTQHTVVHLLAGSVAAGVAATGQGAGASGTVSMVKETVQRRYLIYNQQVPSTRKWRNWQTHQT